MKYRIVADSSLDLNEKLEKETSIEQIAFKLYIDEEEIIDDKDLNVNEFIAKMVDSKKLPRTACPSPNDFKEAFSGEKDVVTMA